MHDVDGFLGVAGGVPLVSYERLIERMVAACPLIPREEIEHAAQLEHDAITGGALLAVPAALEFGLRELLSARVASEGAGAGSLRTV